MEKLENLCDYEHSQCHFRKGRGIVNLTLHSGDCIPNSKKEVGILDAAQEFLYTTLDLPVYHLKHVTPLPQEWNTWYIPPAS